MGTADTSTVSSPLMASDKEHWVDILPVMRNPPMGHYFLSVMRQSTNIYPYSKQKMVKKIRKLMECTWIFKHGLLTFRKSNKLSEISRRINYKT